MKRHIISALVTFLTAFSLYFLTVIDDITLDTFADGAWVALFFVAVRAGVKSLLEYFVLQTNEK
jgi:hypothetical protein